MPLFSVTVHQLPSSLFRAFGPSVIVALLLFGAPQLLANTPVVNDTSTTYSLGIEPMSAPCHGSCDLSPSYNHYVVPTAFQISKITFNWQNNGGNNCDGFGNYDAIISATGSVAGTLATSTNSLYLGCAGFGNGTHGTGELDFSGQAIPVSFFLDFATVDGGVQGGASIAVFDVEIWQVGFAGGVGLSPLLVNFPNQIINITSSVLQVTVTNTGDSSLHITSMPAITGINATDFLIAAGTTCIPGTTLAPEISCAVSLTFTPALAASESASLSIYDDAASSPQQVPLSGIGLAPTVSPASPPSRPVLFVLGICEDSDQWWALRSTLSARMNTDSPNLYPDEKNYDVYYDSGTGTVSFLQGDQPIAAVSIPSSARFFTVRFFDPNGGGLKPAEAAQISILNKANELANIVQEVTRITHIKDVILVAHSMGGLVARAYLEDMASVLPCYDYNNGSGGTPDYKNGFCLPGEVLYQGNIAGLVTLDTPHGGSDLAAVKGEPIDLLEGLIPCVGTQSTAKTEMLPESELLETLNYFKPSIASPSTIPLQVPTASIESYFSDLNPAWEIDLAPTFALTENDGVLSFNNQSMELNLADGAKNGSQFTDWGNPYSEETIQAQLPCEQTLPIDQVPVATVLHFITCLGQQPNTRALTHLIVTPLVNGSLDSINVQVTVDTGHGPVPWIGTINYTVQGTSDIDGRSVSIAATTVPQTFADVPVGTYEVVYQGGGPAGPNSRVVVAPVTTILKSANWNPSFKIGFLQDPLTAVGASVQAPLMRSNGNITAVVLIKNNGNVAMNSVQVTTMGTTLGTASPTLAVLPIANLLPGASATITLTFPITAVLSTATTASLKISGTYSAGTLSGNWSSTFRSITLTN